MIDARLWTTEVVVSISALADPGLSPKKTAVRVCMYMRDAEGEAERTVLFTKGRSAIKLSEQTSANAPRCEWRDGRGVIALAAGPGRTPHPPPPC